MSAATVIAATTAVRRSPRSSRRPAPGRFRREASRSRPLLLIIDDVADQREMYSTYLRYGGYDVEMASGGVEGVAKAVDLEPDLIVMDLSMPGMDGLLATRLLKTISRTRRIPVAALTAYADQLPEEWAMVAGCDAYLRKPMLPADLLEEVDRMLNRRRG